MSASRRVATICVVPQIASAYGVLLQELGHEPVCVITPRRIVPAGTAAEVHRQTRAWNFMPPIPNRGPTLERSGARSRLVSTSLTEVERAEGLDLADGPLWILESEPA